MAGSAPLQPCATCLHARRLAVFFGVYLGVIQNYRFSRYVRYNAMQAVLLDVLLV